MPIPTPRLLLLSLVGLIPIALSGSHDIALGVGVVWLAAIATVAAADIGFAPARDSLLWTAEHDEKLSLGAWNQVTVSVWNRTRRDLQILGRDATPPQLRPDGNRFSGRVLAGGSLSHRFRLYPIHRGQYTLGPLTARVLGPLGLAWRQYSYDLDDRVKVYPNLQAVRTYEHLLHRSHREEMGLRPTRVWGAGTEFERLRDYTPDDEYRRINWAATARRHKPIAVEYETERSQNVILMFDAGRLMSTRLPVKGDGWDVSPHEVQALTRLDHSLNAALLLVYAALQYDDRVGLMAFSDHVMRFVRPGRGRRHFLAALEAMYDIEAEATEVDYAAAFAYLSVHVTRRSLIVVFTDFLEGSSVDTLAAYLARLARRHLPLLVTLRDPELERLARLPTDSSEAVYERSVAMTILQQRDELLLGLRRRGVLTLDATAEELTPALLNRYLDIKGRGRL